MRRGPRGRLRLLVLVVTVLLAIGACGPVEERAPVADGPAIDTMFGPVTVPSAPQRVLALGWSDAETALALGVQPIGASDWLGFGGDGVGPWAQGRYTTPPQMLGTSELSYEQVSSLDPDLILNTRSDGSREKHEELSKIAPTIAPPANVPAYGTNWRQQMSMVSTALGRPNEGARLTADLDAKFARAKADNPAFAGKTTVVGTHYQDKYAAYLRGDSRLDLMEELGFRNRPEVQALANGSFSADLSREQIELLSADLSVVFPLDSDATVLREDQALNQIPAARAGHMVLLDDPMLVNAMASGSTLGTAHTLDRLVPMLAAALGRAP
ncbi:iron ABC transporter substrate-binding protein [Amycolatopsis antarctica]|uniref:Iron ABC transporter substrate-binding protein n=1 Tax=Amycolatopsis antarctica TaxID=1854586 RepID=A0A263D0T2_9PSEU|nr:iron-siderophore ABC transporter substrate-binding protein [Amycolatopsis antarctica]OZM71136.1 iron ABC transporter substrate-binding protein [Amycolatopsis antarctica]